MNHGKKYAESAKLIDRTKVYDPQEALDLCCKTAHAKFDETVELHVRLGVDSRHADQQVRGAVELGAGGLAAQLQGLLRVIYFATVDQLGAFDIVLTMFHCLFLHVW